MSIPLFDYDTIKFMIDHPDQTSLFARRLQAINISPEARGALATITADDWRRSIETLAADDRMLAVGRKYLLSGPEALNSTEMATLDAGKEKLQGELAKHMANIGIAQAVLGAVAAILGVIAVMGGPVAAVIAGMLVAVLVVWIGLLQIASTILAAISAYLPDRLVTTHGTTMFGGNYGTPFSDANEGLGEIAAIKIWHDGILHGIQTGWADPTRSDGIRWSAIHGSETGNLVRVPSQGIFATSEKIVQIEGRAGHFVDNIAFVTSSGGRYGPFGGNGGNEFVIVPEGDGTQIVGFQGRCGLNLDAIGGVSQAYGSAQMGGMGGDPFIDKIPTGARLRRLDVRSGLYIDGIKATYASEGKYVVGNHFGGQGGDLHTLEIDKDEDITEIAVRAGGYVDALQFTLQNQATGARRQWPESGPLGGGGGEMKKLTVPAGKRVIGFWGRSGALIDAIGICVAEKA